jgi:hypothetical protein
MSDILQKKLSRRTLLKGGALLASIGVLATTAAITSTPAIAGVPKAAMQYRDTPNGKQECSNCSLFIPGSSAKANGTCKVVDGLISPQGYCVAYAVKA